MNRRITSSGAGRRGGFSTIGAQKFTDLLDVPGSYVGHAGELPVINATETGLEFKAEPVVDDRKLFVSGTDSTANYLIPKMLAGTAITISEDSSAPADHKAKVDVQLGITGTTACAGNDARLSDARIPTGSAGGDLAGTYPNPTLSPRIVTTAAGMDAYLQIATNDVASQARIGVKNSYNNYLNILATADTGGTYMGASTKNLIALDGFGIETLALNPGATGAVLLLGTEGTARFRIDGNYNTSLQDLVSSGQFFINSSSALQQLTNLTASGICQVEALNDANVTFKMLLGGSTNAATIYGLSGANLSVLQGGATSAGLVIANDMVGSAIIFGTAGTVRGKFDASGLTVSN